MDYFVILGVCCTCLKLEMKFHPIIVFHLHVCVIIVDSAVLLIFAGPGSSLTEISSAIEKQIFIRYYTLRSAAKFSILLGFERWNRKCDGCFMSIDAVS